MEINLQPTAKAKKQKSANQRKSGIPELKIFLFRKTIISGNFDITALFSNKVLFLVKLYILQRKRKQHKLYGAKCGVVLQSKISLNKCSHTFKINSSNRKNKYPGKESDGTILTGENKLN